SRWIETVALFWMATCLLGCGLSGEESVKVTPPPPDAKETLQQIANNGNLKKHKKQLFEEIEGLREAKPQQAEALMAEFQELIAEKDPAAIKAKAQEMADKL
ncbi:MAG: hypothetical protein ACIALR_09435, partial [Blastopirellula sp. JB062]